MALGWLCQHWLAEQQILADRILCRLAVQKHILYERYSKIHAAKLFVDVLMVIIAFILSETSKIMFKK